MPDMLVKLYELPDGTELYKKLLDKGIRIMRPMTPQKHKVHAWIAEKFGEGWANETDTAFTHFPVSCFIAYDTVNKKILGFAAYESTYRDYFGPTGVDPETRKLGIGGALCLRCMEALRDEGYGYAIIGGAGPTEFYRKVVGATVIDGAEVGVYKDMMP